MIRATQDRATLQRWHAFICDACGEEIENWNRVCLLRSTDAIPEDMTVFHTHADCALSFSEQRDGIWERYRMRSPEA